MEEPQNNKIFPILGALLLIVVAFYLLSSDKYQNSSRANIPDESMIVTVENTPMVGDVLPLPEGFPANIPLEEEIVESATTYYPKDNFRQLSVAYKSSKTTEEKFSEYLNYMRQTGYKLKEDSQDGLVISGEKDSVSLFVSINNSGDYTLVQLSYLVR